MTKDLDVKEQKTKYIKKQLSRHPRLKDRIIRTLLVTLHSRGFVKIDEIHNQARANLSRNQAADISSEHNIQIAKRWDKEEKNHIQELALEWAIKSFALEEIEDLFNLTKKRERAQSLEEVAGLSSVSFRVLARKVRDFCRLPVGQTVLTNRESRTSRVALIQHFISDQLEFIGVAKNYLWIRDFEGLLERIIGDQKHMGKIGGKAAGMLLSSRIIEEALTNDKDAPDIKINIPDSYYVRSDVNQDFLTHNGLLYLRDHKYRSLEEIHNDYPMIVEIFKNADFPEYVIKQLEELLQKVGNHPLIVRSSSLLEDRFRTAFAGKYRSVFVSNQGSERERLNELTGAIAEVYASMLHPDPIIYRQQHHLLDFPERMAVLIQKVAGRKCGKYFLPLWAGVCFSRNNYRRNPRIRPEDGLARLVTGLGTRAVDRVSSEFPRMIPLGTPSLKSGLQMKDIIGRSQKTADVINLEENCFESIPITKAYREMNITGLGDVFSVFEDDRLRPVLAMELNEPEEIVVSFDQFTQKSSFPNQLKWILQTLEKAYNCPIDIEVAHDGQQLFLLQCRPQPVRNIAPVQMPVIKNLDQVIFSATRDITNGSVQGIEYIVLVDPLDYDQINSKDLLKKIGKSIRKINNVLREHSFILMGPGRWGSKDIRLGVRVGYSDINHTKMLIEMARTIGGYVPEVSFGSHFFQDMIESDIYYLALYPGTEANDFNETFFHDSPNELSTLLPELKDLENVVKVINVKAITGGKLLNVDMNEEEQKAVGYLTKDF